MTIKVFNLSTQAIEHYTSTLGAREAVIAAFAQNTKKDKDTTEYERRYGHLVIETDLTFVCGDWAALKAPLHTDRPPENRESLYCCLSTY